MKISAYILGVLACISYAEVDSPFENTFRILHQEPPPPESRLRSIGLIKNWISLIRMKQELGRWYLNIKKIKRLS